MKRIGNTAAVVLLALAIAALAFVWYHQAKVVTMPQLSAQFVTLRSAAMGLLVVIGVVVAFGPRWTAILFALVLTYCFAMPLFRFAGKSPFAWALPYIEFVPKTTGEYVTGTMELDFYILWHRFAFAGIVATIAGAGLLLLNDMITRRRQ
jgi:hypothetical protein